jgi:hypothetical protein
VHALTPPFLALSKSKPVKCKKNKTANSKEEEEEEAAANGLVHHFLSPHKSK